MQKFAPNYSKYKCDVTSTNFDPVKLRNGEICPEYYTSVENYDFIIQPYETIPPIKLRKTTHRSTLEPSTKDKAFKTKTYSTVISLQNLLQNSYIVTKRYLISFSTESETYLRLTLLMTLLLTSGGSWPKKQEVLQATNLASLLNCGNPNAYYRNSAGMISY